MTQVIMKQASIFPKVTKEQLYRLVKSYRGNTCLDKFTIELNYLVRVGLIERLSGDMIEYSIK